MAGDCRRCFGKKQNLILKEFESKISSIQGRCDHIAFKLEHHRKGHNIWWHRGRKQKFIFFNCGWSYTKTLVRKLIELHMLVSRQYCNWITTKHIDIYYLVHSFCSANSRIGRETPDDTFVQFDVILKV